MNLAPAAVWRKRGAYILAEGHKNIVYRYPVFLRKFLTKGKLRRVRSLCLYISPAVCYSMDMNIDAYAGFSETEGNNEVGSLAPYPIKFKQLFYAVGDDGIVVIEQIFRNCKNLLCLLPIEAGGIDGFRNLLFTES